MRTLPRRTKHFFDKFANNANKQVPHPNDMKRFYWFIHASHQGRAKLLASEVKGLLLCAGFESDFAGKLADIYHHGRNLLASKPNFSGYRRGKAGA